LLFWPRSAERSNRTIGKGKSADGRTLVLVEWVDSHSGAGGWQPRDEIAGAAEPVYCRSVGWVVSERNGTMVLVSHVSGERNKGVRRYAKGDIAIPKKAVVNVSVLRGA